MTIIKFIISYIINVALIGFVLKLWLTFGYNFQLLVVIVLVSVC
jgi:hypothetical protein